MAEPLLEPFLRTQEKCPKLHLKNGMHSVPMEEE